MPLAAGQRLGSYEILSIIGVGGMGEVYKARDTRLERIVAIKVLPDHVASDPDLRQRFEREAKAISSLSHPHICTLHDIGSEGGVEYLVMEYLEGESLAQRLTRGALPLPQVLRYAMEIAEALDRAHRQGVTHRDLKPGNIMLTKSGAKLLDFGLAKLKTTGVMRSSTSAATASPNVTASGTIIGTLQYMAPEQVEGKPVDQRADIFSFGAIVYEMATGQKAFEGETQASLIGAILRAEPAAISTLQPLSRPAFDALVATCLAKDPDERWQSAGDVARQLRMMQGSSTSGASLPKGQIGMPRTAAWRPSLPVAATALVLVAAAAAATVWALLPRAREEPKALTRFAITPPASTPLSSLGGYDAIVSPDGKRIAYFVETDNSGGIQLYLRDLAELEPRLVPRAATAVATNGNMNPFFSPDGRSIGIYLPGQGVLRISLDGGPPLKILADEGLFLGAVWEPDDTWIFSSGDALHRVSATVGGKPERLTPPAEAGAAVPFHVAPVVLPGGRAVLFGLVGGSAERVAALDLKTHVEKIILDNAGNPSYVAPGRLLFARGTTLMAVAFDASKLAVVGEPVVVLQGVRHPNVNSAADYQVPDDGTLVYVPDDGGAATSGSVVWVDREGHVTAPAVDGVLNNPRDPRLSPDGRRLLLTTGPLFGGQLWIYDLSGKPPIPLTSEGDNTSGTWSPDGARIAFSGTGGLGFGTYDLLTLAADGSERAPRAVRSEGLGVGPAVWTSAGELITFRVERSQILAVPLDGGPVRDVLASADQKGRSDLSHDGRWLAYESNRSGAVEIWVKRYPDGAEVRVTQNGGRDPVWSRDGRELYYRQGSAVMAVAVQSGEDFSFAPSRQLFDAPFFAAIDPGIRTYDVAADGRFVMIQPRTDSKRTPASVVVVQNWADEVKRRVPIH